MQLPDPGRRQLIRNIGLGAAIAGAGLWSGAAPMPAKKRHIISLCWDDGFKESTRKTAAIFEKHRLAASFNVIASGHFKSFTIPDAYQVTEKGDFVMWNDLRRRGHEIMPHSYKHANLRDMPLEEAQHLVSICLAYFAEHLDGFRADRAIFHFPYNSSTPELEAWLSPRVRAFRTNGGGLNPLPHPGQSKLTCIGFGPGNTEENLEKQIKKLFEQPTGWLIYNTHGLDGEGWGPMRSEYLDELLGRLVAIETVAVLPPGVALSTAARA